MHCTIKRIEAMDDKFLIHVEIAGKSYGIRINRSEEQVAREAVRQIRKKMEYVIRSTSIGNILLNPMWM